MSYREWGIGHWALGMGHWALGNEYSISLVPSLSLPCPQSRVPNSKPATFDRSSAG
ncbi:MAG: hypothetical protein VKL59_07975 [Nostocaceae cyanobacterium]|nr:hypothetical protein [Nostocaceae cyanobacterium]